MKTTTSLSAEADGSVSAYKRLRHSLARIRCLQSAYRFGGAVGDLVIDGPQHSRTELDAEFQSRSDPWDYTTDLHHMRRIQGELAMLDAVRKGANFAKALEVGCAEGIFTQQLAPRCESLLAVDISTTALARAGRRCQMFEQVLFLDWDIRTGSLAGDYDLIVAIHSIEYLRNPVNMRRARAKLVDWLSPGGFLLLGTMREVAAIENSWWSRLLLRGGGRINDFFAHHPALRVVDRAEFQLGDDRLSGEVLFRKVG